MTYQNKIIIEYILAKLEQHEIDIDADIDIDNIIDNKIGRLSFGQDIALNVEDNVLIGIYKLDSFEDSSIINRDSIIISYRELEAIYYETISF